MSGIARDVTPDDVRMLFTLSREEGGGLTVPARVSFRGVGTADVVLRSPDALRFFFETLTRAFPASELDFPGVPDIDGPAELRAMLEEQGGLLQQAVRRISELERELEGYHRAAAPPIPALQPALPGIAAALVAPVVVEPDVDDGEKLAELEDIAARINRDELVALTELRTFVEGCKFRRLEGELERAYERASELIGMATDDAPPPSFGPERRTGR
jgi:hypothetical protein